jgi:predicted methyltransferase
LADIKWRHWVFALLLALPATATRAATVPDYVAAAVADPARPDADKKDDANRKPAETVAFAKVKPGEKVGELLPGAGYYTRILSKTVGPAGHVYAVVSEDRVKDHPHAADAPNAIAADPAFSNVSAVVENLREFSAPEKLDMVWTSRNYHDFYNKPYEPGFADVLNKAVFAALKPGGIYFVLDHAAAPGSGLRDTSELHRIDPKAARREIQKAGFVFDGESKILRNPKDIYTDKVFDGAVQGKTDQFIYRFRKPRK